MNSFAYNSTDDDLLKAAESILQGSLQEAQKLASLSLHQLKTRFASLGNQIDYLEDKKGFAPEELKAEFRAIDAEIKSRKNMKEGAEDFYSQKMIKNQLQTIVRNSNACLEMIEAGRKFPEWAQSEIAVAEDGIVSVTEFMQSHSDGAALDEASFNMGTATITSPGHTLDGKTANIFHKFDDGRINVQYRKSNKKGDVVNMTLKKGQYKLDEGAEIDKNFKMLTDYSSKLSQLISMTGGASTPIGRILIDELGAAAKQKLSSVRSKLVDAEEEFDALGADYSAKTSK